MGMEGKPKFLIGEPVIIEKTGTVSKIAKIHRVDGRWYYELIDQNELYLEKSLSSCVDKKILFNREKVDIEYKFHFGDIVSVKGYPDELFVIIGFRAEIWRYKDSAWEDIIYELSHIQDGSWLEASQDELTFVAKDAHQLVQLSKATYNKTKIQSSKRNTKEKELINIDKLLDMYNDYRHLYEMFGEISYKRKMKEILIKLEALSQHPFPRDSN